jgi:RNA polymerase sigma factor (sigma-70 family)
MKLDNDLKKRVIDGDRRAQHELYRLCFNLLYGVAGMYKKNEEDKRTLVNNTFIKIINNLDKHEEISNFAAWSKRIIMNEIIDDYRKQKKYKEFINQDHSIDNIEIVDHSKIEYHYSEQELFAMVNKLPNATKLVFSLFSIDGLTHKEICDQLNITAETSKWHMKIARQKLKSY